MVSIFRQIMMASGSLWLFFACAGQQASHRTTHIAILQLRSIGVKPDRANLVRQSLADEIANKSNITVIEQQKVNATIKKIPACQLHKKSQEDTCAIEVGTALQASHVVAGALGALGQTHILQLRLIRVAEGAVIRSVEETLFGDPGSVGQAIPAIAERLFRTGKGRPWYKRWWLWTAAAAAVGIGVALPLILTEDDPYTTITLPLRPK